MIHDDELLNRLTSLNVDKFSGDVYRATRTSLDPLAPSQNGGRWMPKAESSVLYTSLDRDGALAELTYYWGRLDPLPSKPASLSTIEVNVDSTIRILRSKFDDFGLTNVEFSSDNYNRTTEIGAAAAFLEFHGLIVPNARWDCENLILFTDNLLTLDCLQLKTSENIDWQAWGKKNGMLPNT